MAEWPRVSITTRGDTPWARSSEAQVCRRSWNRVWRSPAVLSRSVNTRLAFLGSNGVPVDEVNTKSSGPIEPPRLAASLAACRWCRFSAAICHRGQRHSTAGALRLRRHELQSAIHSLQRLAHAQLATVEIDIL